MTDAPTSGWEPAPASGGREPPLPPVVDTRRYTMGTVLGKGGMGEVRLCEDQRIGREVAMKVVLARHAARDPAHSRFLYEARLQARLEHPAIVPVYDVGQDETGAAYFTMKPVRGRTLSDVLRALQVNAPWALRGFGRRKLLTAFGQVCLALDYAHSRGVVHRDLKPQNVMLGDFGEVYVLDWGLAKVTGDVPRSICEPSPDTRKGYVAGTPGYMPPEQMKGQPVDPRTDVYALGAILWEIIVLEARPVDDTKPEVGLASRAPLLEQPAPELLRIADRAMAYLPDDRYASARELWADVERYLDGHRDLELRRTQAAAHARAGEELVAAVLADEAPDNAERRRALRHLGQALALDPTHAAARRALVRLLVEPPDAIPHEVKRSLDQSRAAAERASGIGGSMALAYCLVVGLFAWALSERITWMAVSWVVLMGGALVLRIATIVRHTIPLRVGVLLLSMAAFATTSEVGGSLLVLPGIIAANTITYVLHPHAWLRRAAVVTAVSCLLVPLGLERLDVIDSAISFVDGAIVIRTGVAYLREGPSMTILLLIGLGMVLLPVLYVGRTARALERAEQRLALYAWQMRQLVADERDESRPQS